MKRRPTAVKRAQLRQAIRVALNEGIKTTAELASRAEIAKLQPSPPLLRQLLIRMATDKEIRKVGYAQYASLNGGSESDSATPPAPRAIPGFVQRIAHIEHMLEQLMKALEVKER
jgi:hypothetical protein